MLQLFFLGSFFFFSSRRRHTRSLCDWSSDVCSSDLPLSPVLSLAPNVEFRHELAGPATGRLALLGWLVRPGVDVRYRASGTLTVLVQGQAAFGRLAGGGGSVSLVGPRAVVLLEWAQ